VVHSSYPLFLDVRLFTLEVGVQAWSVVVVDIPPLQRLSSQVEVVLAQWQWQRLLAEWSLV